ncbi:alpha/beta hydrolase [Desulfosarcina alkanivorans]|uniref:Alpha/beta hydrolase n=1 Tax=Desulfosarcina alkanivorans TaxID=571177 RepID=A0A5K7YH83_9BACT|nr:alpha/beta family hydrolase [Desulfosarcina alkanivorans]BBO67430.1 alpha/beta hydrolase [Desulfosarcina alkanivorans]
MAEDRQTIASEKAAIDIGGRDQVSAILSGPERASEMNPTGVIVAHGAGNDMHNPLIVAVAEGLAAAGSATLRFNFPYKEKGRKSPDSQNKLIHTWQCVCEYFMGNPTFPVRRVIAAGKSMGGRVASQMVAGAQMDAAALIFLGYPLHAPGKKNQLRDAHLYQIKKPMLFFAGTKDPLCDVEKLNSVLARLTCDHDLDIIDGGNHSLKLPKSSPRSEADVHRQVVEKCVGWVEQLG